MLNKIVKASIASAMVIVFSATSQASDIFPASLAQSWIANQPVTPAATQAAAKDTATKQHPSLVVKNESHKVATATVALRTK